MTDTTHQSRRARGHACALALHLRLLRSWRLYRCWPPDARQVARGQLCPFRCQRSERSPSTCRSPPRRPGSAKPRPRWQHRDHRTTATSVRRRRNTEPAGTSARVPGWLQPAESPRRPDVSALADIVPGWPDVIDSALQPVGGTSGSTPFIAAATALVDGPERAAGRPRVGLANGWFYKAASQPGAFFDITAGNNDLAGVGCC